MKLKFLFVLSFFPFYLFGQLTDSLSFAHTPRSEKTLFLSGGYHFYPKDSTNRAKHSIELGIAKTSFILGVNHPVGLGWNIGTEAVLAKDFILGPKIGGYIQYASLILGTELVYYTDFDQGSLRNGFYFGAGNTRIQVLIGGNFALANEDFTQMNYGKVSVIYRFLPLKEKITF